MPEQSLAVLQPQGAVVVSNEWEKALDLVQKTVAPGLSPENFALFCHVARVRHLDPLQRQIHAVMRKTWNKDLNGGRGGYTESMTIQTGIDGYRAIANRTKLYMPSEKQAVIEDAGTENMRITMHVKKYHPESGSWHEFSATAWYREFVQTRKDGDKIVPNAMWEKMPVNQLTKCAEALALRKGWPEELGGIYVDEEMQHLDLQQSVAPADVQVKVDKTKRELGTMKESASPNRGHGNEGTAQTQTTATICAECRQRDGKHTDDCKQNLKAKAAKSQKAAQKPNAREQWDTHEGHDPAKHISFEEFLQLCDIQKKLNINDDQLKNFLDGEFSIRTRSQIRQDEFQKVLDALETVFGGATKPSADDADGFGLTP